MLYFYMTLCYIFIYLSDIWIHLFEYLFNTTYYKQIYYTNKQNDHNVLLMVKQWKPLNYRIKLYCLLCSTQSDSEFLGIIRMYYCRSRLYIIKIICTSNDNFFPHYPTARILGIGLQYAYINRSPSVFAGLVTRIARKYKP